MSFETRYLPGQIVDWRRGPFDPWSPARVEVVSHAGDAAGWFTVVEVVPVGMPATAVRRLTGPSLAMCLRPRAIDDPMAVVVHVCGVPIRGFVEGSMIAYDDDGKPRH